MTQVKGINKLVEMILEPKPMFSEIKVRFKELECKTNTILSLMHHMCISTTNVSSVDNCHAKKFGNPKYYKCKDPPPHPKPPKTAKKNEFFMELFQISTSIVFSNQKMITGKITLRMNQNMRRKEHSHIFSNHKIL
jgi:hypothetical protein